MPEFEPIVEEMREPKPKSRRGFIIIVLSIVGVAAITIALILLLGSGDGTHLLALYNTAVVEERDLQDRRTVSGEVDVLVKQELKAPGEGRFGDLRVDEGDQVTRGDVLAVIESPALEDRLEEVTQELQQKERALAERIRDHELYMDQTVDGDSGLSAAQRRMLETVRMEADLLFAVERDQQETEIAELRAEQTSLRRQIAALRVVAPFTGRVIAVSRQATQVGTPVTAETAILTIADTSQPIVQLSVPAAYAAELTVGDTIEMSVGASPAVGRVDWVGAIPASDAPTESGPVPIEVTIAQADEPIVPGTVATAEIVLDEVEGALALPRGPFRTTGNGRYVYVVRDGRGYRTEVTYGVEYDGYIQLTSGVSAGDVVITSGYQDILQYEEVRLRESPGE